MAILVLGATLILLTSLFVDANAQTPEPTIPPYPDIPLDQVSGTYTVKAQMPDDADVTQLCVVRVDLVDVIEYGCVDAGPSVIASMEITVEVTPDVNAEIKAYAKDAGGLVSNYSPNSGWIDFTKPSSPVIIP
jgi:hypothetical protein